MVNGYLPHKSKHAKPGDVFGRLTVTSVVRGGGRGYAVCNCECGTREATIRISSLVYGYTQSCGCIHKETFTTHGLSQHRLYHTWKNMMHRCSSETANGWENYGKRGISVSERWHDIRNFIADMEATYEEGLLLDRIDNNQGYSLENCRWVNWDVQATNKRHVTLIEFQGRKQTLKLWCLEYGIHYVTAKARINKGWDPIAAFTLPVDKTMARNVKTKPSLTVGSRGER